MALINKLGAIGDAIREKTGGTELLTLDAMPTEILSIETGGGGDSGIPEEAFTITGDCSYRFANDGWNWFIEEYKNKIKTKNITNSTYMFCYCSLEEIPFDINLHPGWALANLSNMFVHCEQLKVAPKITGPVYTTDSLFHYCARLRELKEESVAEIDWSPVDNATSGYAGDRSELFRNCYSLRKYPNSFLAHGNPVATYSYSLYYYLFNRCASLDEVVDLPVLHRNATWTYNAFNYTFEECFRLKRVTFETNEDGSPIVVNGWSKQSIDLSKVGTCVLYTNQILDYNSGITNDTKIRDDASYQALKDHPDNWNQNWDYCRYNHDSAVETINTLPDLSGGAGGNTIKFKGAAGAKTDGGAINTMTEEEIAVATAKGWTVTFV